MTLFGIYLVTLLAVGVLGNFYNAGQGGATYSPGILIFSGFIGIANILGILVLGTGLGL